MIEIRALKNDLTSSTVHLHVQSNIIGSRVPKKNVIEDTGTDNRGQHQKDDDRRELNETKVDDRLVEFDSNRLTPNFNRSQRINQRELRRILAMNGMKMATCSVYG